MSKSNSIEDSFLNILYLATAWANVADNAASSPLTSIAVAAHTADPGEAGNQTTSEAGYSGYSRPTALRSSSGFNASSGGSVGPAAVISFGASSASGTTLTHFSTGKTGGGATIIFHSGTLTPNVAIGAAGITPQLDTPTTITED